MISGASNAVQSREVEPQRISPRGERSDDPRRHPRLAGSNPNRCVAYPFSCCALFLVIAQLGASMPCIHAAPLARELITCGRDKVLILDLNARDAVGTPKTIWSWRAADRAELPADVRVLFRSTDDCKPVDGGRRILITSSSGGVALVERANGAVVFYGRAVNATRPTCCPVSQVQSSRTAIR